MPRKATRAENIHYVYEHWRPDKDVCFYVGKGCGRRANDMCGRHPHHKRIQKKLARLGMCVEVRLVAEGMTHDDAIAYEIERIAFWRKIDMELVNKSDGGEGLINPTPDTREKMRCAKVGRKLTSSHKQAIADATRIALAEPARREAISARVRISHARPEVKAKMSLSQKGRVRTKEHYEKVSASLTGKKLSPAHAEKIRVANTGRKQSAEEIENRSRANTGKKRTPEFCARMKAAWTPERRAAQSVRTKGGFVGGSASLSSFEKEK